eukprot:TRINITY_DN3702_c0_g3_i2.p1 TRINITY_DN3702_c0_g3~~TRINITY_DN3702_c0_g3_i2.p1  ORF type:complete len:1932 (+),score=265.28 TRINITY_DN3702_c0_g3_i2:37-5796(+)
MVVDGLVSVHQAPDVVEQSACAFADVATPDGSDSEDADFDTLLAQFKREDSTGLCRTASLLADVEAVERAVCEARVRQTLRATRSSDAEATACFALAEKRRRFIADMRRLRLSELRDQIVIMRKRMDSQTQLLTTLQAELKAVTSQQATVSLQLTSTSTIPAPLHVHESNADFACGKMYSCEAHAENEETLSPVGNVCAHIRAELQKASGTAAAEMLGRAVRRLGAEQYGRREHVLEELIQNADDCHFLPECMQPELQVHGLEDQDGVLNAFCLWHNEVGFSDSDVRALCNIGRSTKESRGQGQQRKTGCKGVGFKSVFLVTDTPMIFSRGGHFSFSFDQRNELGSVFPLDVPRAVAVASAPQWLKQCLDRGTMLHLPLTPSCVNAEDLENILRPAPEFLLFLRRLRSLVVTRGIPSVEHPRLLRRFVRLEDELCEDMPFTRRSIEMSETCGSSNHVKRWRKTWAIYTHMYRDYENRECQLILAFPLATESSSQALQTAPDVSADVFCGLPVQKVGLPFMLNAEDMQLTTGRSAVCESAPANVLIRQEALRAAVSAHKFGSAEIRRSLMQGMFLRLRKDATDRNPSAESPDMRLTTNDAHTGFFEPLLQGLLTHLRQLPCLKSEAGEWRTPDALRIRPPGCSKELFSNHALSVSCDGAHFVESDGGCGLDHDALLHLGVGRLKQTELISALQGALTTSNALSSAWFRDLYAFLLTQHQDLADAGLLPTLRALHGLVRLRPANELLVGDDASEVTALDGTGGSPRLFLGIAADALWPQHDLQRAELLSSGAIRLVLEEDFATPEARRFLTLQGLSDASLEDCADELARMHCRGRWPAREGACWAGLRYLCRAWPRLREMSCAETLRSSLTCPCEDGGIRPLADVYVRTFLGEVCTGCSTPPKDVCGILPPSLDAEGAAAGLIVCNEFAGKALYCSAQAPVTEENWLSIRSSCGVTSGRWRFDVFIEEFGDAAAVDGYGSLAVGWATAAAPAYVTGEDACIDPFSALICDAGWMSLGKDAWYGEAWTGICTHVSCFIEAAEGFVQVVLSDELSDEDGSFIVQTDWMKLPPGLIGAELWPFVRLRRGAKVHVSFTGPTNMPQYESSEEEDYAPLARACRARSRKRAHGIEGQQHLLAALPDHFAEPDSIEWEAMLVGLGARAHCVGCAHRHRWFSALEDPFSGDCPLCLAPLAETPDDAGVLIGAVALPCEHKFHASCAQQIIASSATNLRCPVCRDRFQERAIAQLGSLRDRRAEKLSSVLSACLTGHASASSAALLRQYTLDRTCKEMLRRLCVPTSVGAQPIEESFLPCPALRALRVRSGSKVMPFLSNVVSEMTDVVEACGASISMNGASALQALRYLRQASRDDASLDLARFLYGVVAEGFAETDNDFTSILKALSSDDLILAQSHDQLVFARLRNCLWDGSPALAKASGLHGPLKALYGDSDLLFQLFHHPEVAVRHCDVEVCARVLSRLASLELSEEDYCHFCETRLDWSQVQATVDASYAQLESLLETYGDDNEAIRTIMDREEWHVLCVRDSDTVSKRLLRVGKRPRANRAPLFVYDCDDTNLAELFKGKVYMLPEMSVGQAPRPPPRMLKALKALPFGIQSLTQNAFQTSDPILQNEIGLQRTYTWAARMALRRCGLDCSILSHISAYTCGTRKISMPVAKDVYVTSSAVLRFALQHTEPESQHVSGSQAVEIVLLERKALDVKKPLEDNGPFLPCELLRTLAEALAEMAGSSDVEMLHEALTSYLPNPPPLREPKARRKARRQESPAAGPQPPTRSNVDAAAAGSSAASASAAPSVGSKSRQGAFTSAADLRPGGVPGALVKEMERGLEDVFRGLETLRLTMQRTRALEDQANLRAAASSNQLLWDPSAIVGEGSRNASSSESEIASSLLRARLSSLSEELNDLKAVANFR